MDWSKAKNIIIAALIAANLFLGFEYYNQVSDSAKAEEDAVRTTESYLQYMGIELNCSIPAEREKLPVVFVNIEEGRSEETSKDGIAIVVTGAQGLCAVPTDTGDTRAQVISASEAVRRFTSMLPSEELKGLSIEGIRLVYRVDRAGLGMEQKHDTAVPAWEITSNGSVCYIEGFDN